MAQVWVVTGSSRGLGRAIVEAGLAAGNKVLATTRDIDSLSDVAERYGDQMKLFAPNVTDEAAAICAVKTARRAIRASRIGLDCRSNGLVSVRLQW
jgi:NADP-dependent 3-hydroxy acid dehydrogenase YdfG